MKKRYQEPSLYIIKLTADVIRTSGNDLGDGDWGVRDGFVRQ